MALSPEEVEEVAEALCVRSPDCAIRSLLVDRIPPKLWGSVPQQRAVIDQYRSDLQALRGAKANSDEPALAIYLENAARLLDSQPAAERCQRLAARIRRGPTWVVLFRPREVTDWRKIHPGAESIAADVPSGPWHRSERPGREAWVRAFAEVERIAAAVKGDPRPTAVYSSMPYSLGAVLGNALLNELHGRCRFFQAEGPIHDIQWVDYGPRTDVKPRPTPVLTHLSTTDGREDHVALICGVTWHPETDEIEHGLRVGGAEGATRVHIGPAEPGHQALPDPADVERAVRDLEAAMDQEVRRPGIQALHVFFNGPLAVLQRAAGKLHQPKTRIVVHDRGVDGTYWPAVAFEGGRARLLAPEPVR